MSGILEARNLFWRYPSYAGSENPWAIRGVDLCVEKGEVFGITGPSGAGKTTLCRLLLGLLPHGTKIPHREVNYHIRGEVSMFGEPVTHIDETANVVDGEPLGEVQGKGILSPRAGMVMQDPENQFLQMSLLHELAFGLSLQSLGVEEIRVRSKRALDMVGLGALWKDAENIHPMDLSGGQKQRVAIAAFLALNPEVLILDEPTSDLDPLGKHEVIQTVWKLKESQAMTILLVEQDPELLYQFCDRIALMDQGQIIAVAPPGEFYTDLDLLEKHGAATFEVSQIAKSAHLGEPERPPVSIEEFAPRLQALRLAPDPASPPGTEGQAIIQIEDLHYRYTDGTLALQGVDLVVHKGEMTALLGINGSGKTTLAKIMAGIYPPGPGGITVFGADLHSRGARRDLPQHVGYVFQNPDHQLFTRRVGDEILYGMENVGIPPSEREAILVRTLGMVGLLDQSDEDPLFLGKGQRQRLAVAAVLAMGPELIIVDEPTTGQDHRMVTGIMSLLKELHEQGKTILVITHDMNLVANYCTRAVVLLDGRVVFEGEPRRLFADPSILEKTHLRSPQAIRMSLAMRRTNPEFPILLNVSEWIRALNVPGREPEPK